MRVGSRGSRGFVFFIGKQLPQFLRGLVPFLAAAICRLEYACNPTPAHIPGKHGLFFIGRVPFFSLKMLQEPDGFDVRARFFMRAAQSDPVVICDSEIAGGLLGFVEDDSSGRRNSFTASSHAW